MVCPSCGRENPADARFCSGCATPIGEVPPVREERKVVTVLFCDLVGSTAQAERLDPEDVRALLSHYHERVKTELERFGGTVEKFIGDAVMALFGAPVAHEDDPERAVRAALAIREWAQEAGELQVRIGITTGEALVALTAQPQTGEGMASGDVVNTAARLQSSAPENGVLVDETTYRSTRKSIEYGDGRAVEAKGKKHAVNVWEAIQARSRFGVDVRQEGGAALVGRETELDLIVRTLERVRREREPQLVTLVGVPGIGKSRLVYELFRHVDAEPDLTTWRQGRSLPYGEGVSFWALGEMVKAQAGILDTDGSDEAARKLRASIDELGIENGDWVEKQLRPLVGAAGAAAPSDQSESFAAWRDYIEALADERPLVLVFEDLHWADEGLLEFVDHLVDWASGVPLLVVGTARPELLTRRSDWGGGKPNATTHSLGPLSRDETSRLVHALLERAVLPVEIQEALLERAEGNPLYAEEFARLVADGREPDELPETIQGLIAARLDLLAPDEKTLLQHAAVIGKVFWAGAVAHVGDVEPASVGPLLHELVRRELTRRERRASIAGETEFVFRHALVRDVAYAQIPRASRSTMHRRAAEWIELLGRPEDKVELLAHHYLAALELAAASHQSTDDFVDRARDAFRAAGERAFALHAYPTAQSYYAQAIDLAKDADPDYPYLLLGAGQARAIVGDEGGDDLLREAADRLVAIGDRGAAAEAEVRMANTAWHRGDPAAANDHVDRAAALIAELSPSGAKARVLAQVARRRLLSGETDVAIEVGREALALAVALDLPDTQADASITIGSARCSIGDRDGVSDIESAISISEALGSPGAVRGYNNLAWVMDLHGDARTREQVEHALRIARRFGQAHMVAFGRANLIDFQYQEGEWEECLAVAEEFIVEAETGTPRYQESSCLTCRAMIRLARAQDEAALADARSALTRARVVADPQIIDRQLVMTAYVEALLGERKTAERLVDELGSRFASDLVLSIGQPVLDLIEMFGDSGDLARLGRGRTNTRFRQAALAFVEGDLLGGAAIYAEIGHLVDEAQLRLKAAEQLLGAGRRPDASEQLARAVAFFRSVGATRYLSKADALLRMSA